MHKFGTTLMEQTVGRTGLLDSELNSDQFIFSVSEDISITNEGDFLHFGGKRHFNSLYAYAYKENWWQYTRRRESKALSSLEDCNNSHFWWWLKMKRNILTIHFCTENNGVYWAEALIGKEPWYHKLCSQYICSEWLYSTVYCTVLIVYYLLAGSLKVFLEGSGVLNR